MDFRNLLTETPSLLELGRVRKMKTRPALSCACVVAVFLLLSSSGARAGRLIATPYAETLPEGRYSVWQFALRENRSTDNWRSLNRLDLGITDRIELGIFVINPRNAPTDTWLNIQYRVATETADQPTISVGVWDAADIGKFSGQSTGGSFFIALGKTVKPKRGATTPQYLKVSLGAGTNRLNGLFGGFDLRCNKDTGIVAEYMPTNLRLPQTDSVDVGVYHWLSPHWRARVSWMGGNPMVDIFYTGIIGK